MNKLLSAASVLLAGTAAFAQPAPAPVVPPAPPAPMAHPMHDKVTTRAEVTEKVREHFARLDANKDGTITTAEIDESHAKMMKDFSGGGHIMMLGDPNVAFDRLDANKDGSISREEFAKAREQRVERRIVMREEMKDGEPAAEASKDGKQIRRQMWMHRGGGFGGGMIVMADTNKDGQITLAEAETLALQHFDQMDANKDGQVTPDERRAARPMMIKRMEVETKPAS
jgi:Ca2+-binding EF-hand superfamily protein